jgi:tetratricopeptide (TPR) repeat protein
LLWSRRCALALLPLLLLGCATPPQTAALRAQPAAAVQLTVPFVPQQDYQCGPAALQMALRASGAQVDLQTLVAQVFLPARQGSLQPEMLATARRHGRLAVVLPPQLDAILAEMHAGHPVIVLQNLALPVAPRWHYAVVIGYDPDRAELILHSGTTASLHMPLAVFERTWARSGHWAMVATAPQTPAASASIETLVQAAVALERVDAAAGLRAYRALTQHDATSYGAWFGLGTAALQQQELETARTALGRAVALRADAADAWNNLALAHLHLREPDRALEAAQRAVALGGPRAERYQATLAAARQALQPTPGPQPR